MAPNLRGGSGSPCLFCRSERRGRGSRALPNETFYDGTAVIVRGHTRHQSLDRLQTNDRLRPTLLQIKLRRVKGLPSGLGPGLRGSTDARKDSDSRRVSICTVTAHVLAQGPAFPPSLLLFALSGGSRAYRRQTGLQPPWRAGQSQGSS